MKTPENGDEAVFLLAKHSDEYPLTWDRHTIKPKERFLIGRSFECNIEIRDANAAKKHCYIEPRDGVLWLVDCASFHGTRLNDERITKAPLSSGDKLRIGETIFYVSSVEAQVVPQELLLACRQSTDVDTLWSLARQRWEFSREVAQNIHAPGALLSWLANSPDRQSRKMVAQNPSTPPPLLLHLRREFLQEVRANPSYTRPPLRHTALNLMCYYKDYPPQAMSFSVVDDQRFILGRYKDCEIILSDLTVGRRHAMIEEQDGDLWLIDLSSSNGTYLNGEIITRTMIQPGDKIQIGAFLLLLCTSFETFTPEEEAVAQCTQSTDADTLWAMARRHWELSKLVAQNVYAPSELLAWLASSRDESSQRLAAQNPSTPPSALLYLLRDFAEEVVENPVFDLILLETPEFLSSFSVPLSWREHTNPKLRRLAAMT